MKWWRRILQYPEVWVLTVLALLTRLWNIGWPHSIVFDEVYFREFPAHYLSGQYFFDVHPPFVKLLFASVASLFQLSPDQTAAGDPGTVILRFAPALAGAALVPLVYIILRQLRMSRRIATLGAALVLFDGALLVESRFVLMDSVLLLTGFGALSAYLASRRATNGIRWAWVLVMAVLLGMLVSTKWSGLAMAGFVFLVWLVDGIRSRRKWFVMTSEFIITLLIVGGVYVGSFALHFALLTHSGEGDAFMSERFQSTLVDGAFYNPAAKMSFWDKFVELNGEMFAAQTSLNDVSHPYASSWYSWPLMVRPVYYWQGEVLQGDTQGHIYLLGNPVAWLLATTGTVLAMLILLVRRRWLGRSSMLVAGLLVGYLLNFLPFAFIDRPMFLYHYFFAFVISILITCIVAARFFDWQATRYGKVAAKHTFWIAIGVIVLCFLYFLPISYGWPLSSMELQQHMWLPTWR